MTTFGPLDELVASGESEYGGGPGLVQVGPDGRELYGGEKLGVITRAGKEIERTAGASLVDDAVDPVTKITVTEAQADGPVPPRA